MSQRLAQALQAGRVVVVNDGGVEVNCTMVRFTPGKGKRPTHSPEIIALKPRKEIDLTRRYSIPELQASCQLPKGLQSTVASYPIRVIQTW